MPESVGPAAPAVETGRGAADDTEGLRVVVLGASNVAFERRHIAGTVAAAVAGLGGRSELFLAGGHGRSYLKWSFVGPLGRPPLTRCGLWTDATRPDGPRRRHALVTDVGNDLLYGRGADETAAAVGTCLSRLAEADFRIVLTRLPVARLRGVTPAAYHVLCRIAYPGVPVRPVDAMRREIDRLENGLESLAETHGATLSSQPPDWYGLDPIHRTRRGRGKFWDQIAAAWGGPFPGSPGGAPPPIPLAGASRRLWFGRRYRTPQPAAEAGRIGVSVY